MALSEADVSAACEAILACFTERPSWSDNDLRKQCGLTLAIFKMALDSLLAEEVLLLQFDQVGKKAYILAPPSIAPVQRLEGPLTLLASSVLARLIVKADGSKGLERVLGLEAGHGSDPLEELERLGWIERKYVGMLTIYRPRAF